MKAGCALTSVLKAAALSSALLLAPRAANATVLASPFAEGAYGYVANFIDGHWVGWLPKTAATCSNIRWQYIAPTTGFTDNVHVTGNATDDVIREDTAGGTLCGWAMTAPIHNGYWLILGGSGGNDTLIGTDSITALFGDSGNDALWSFSRTRVFYGGNDNDVFMGCSYENGGEQYIGGSGTDYVADRNNAWLTMDGVERNAGSCPI